MKESKKNTKDIKQLFLIPIIAVLGFIPVIVHMHQYDAKMESYAWFPEESNIRVDMFMAYKSYAVMLFAGIMLLILVIQAVKKKREFRMETSYYLLLIYAIFVVMSGFFSKYKPQVFTGSYEIFQPMEVILGYLLICFYTYQYTDSEKRIKKILQISAIGMGIVVAIGVSQFIGYDFLQSTVGRLLISDAYHLDKLDTINFSLPKHTVYTTLYNPDFLSFYFGIVTPIVIAAFVSASKFAHKVIWGILFIGCMMCMIGADTAAGYIAFAVEMIVGIYVYLSRKGRRLIIGTVIGIVAVILGIIICVTTPIGTRVNQLFWGTQRSINDQFIKSIDTTEEDICFDLGDKEIHVSYDVNQEDGQFVINFTDGNSNPLSAEAVDTDNGVVYALQDISLGGCQANPVVIDDELALHVNLDNYDWYFKKQEADGYYYYNPFGKWEKISKVKKSTLFCDDALSGRGNIWNLTIPILGKHIIMGSGANTYGFELPQNDYVYKIYKGYPNLLVAKAHNWFLQEWIENGLIATLCLLGFVLWYLIRSVHIYRRCDLHNHLYLIGFSIFVGTIGYVTASLANDSNICTAPVFWVLIAIGMSINSMFVEKEPLTVKEVPEASDGVLRNETPNKSISKNSKNKSRRDRKKTKK